MNRKPSKPLPQVPMKAVRPTSTVPEITEEELARKRYQ